MTARSFYQIVEDLTAEYDKLQRHNMALVSENTSLRAQFFELSGSQSHEIQAATVLRDIDKSLPLMATTGPHWDGACPKMPGEDVFYGVPAFDGSMQEGYCRSEVFVAPADSFRPQISNDSASSLDSSTSWSLKPTSPCGRLRVRPIWRKAVKDELDIPEEQDMPCCINVKGLEASTMETLRSGDARKAKGIMQKFVITPGSLKHIALDLLSLLVVGYDILLIPLAAFNLEQSALLYSMMVFITIFWSFDICLTFFIGYHDEGIVELRPHKIMKRYIRNLFVLDVTLVLFDWVLIIGDGSENVFGLLRIGKSVRFARVMRMFRLLRLMKVLPLIENLVDTVHSFAVVNTLKIVIRLVGIAVANHFVACLWYALGTTSGHSETWVEALLDKEGQASGLYLYTTALHWSWTQFTPSSMEVVPRNTKERIFAISVIVLALVVFSSFVSKITEAMATLRDRNAGMWQQQEHLRKYIADNRVSLELGNCIHNFARKHRSMVAKKRVHEEDISVILMMPETMRVQLHCEVFSPVLVPHPFFQQWLEIDMYGVSNICHSAMSEISLSIGQELFIFGTKGAKMYFLIGGEMTYCRGAGGGEGQALQEGDHICEMVLWMSWVHQGFLSAKITGEFVALDAELFGNCARQSSVFSPCREYAKLYLERLAADVDEDNASMSDLWGSFDMKLDIAQQAFGSVRIEPKLTRRFTDRFW